MWFFLLVLIGSTCAQNWELVWFDEFDGNEIDATKWEHEITAWGGGNGEFQVYTPMPENSFVQDGLLHLRPTNISQNRSPSGEPFGEDFIENGVLDLEAMYGRCDVSENNGCYRTGRNDNSHQDIPVIASARLRTADRFAYRYGRVVISASMPVGDWLWPAMWMLPEHWKYGGWPESGEIDIVEIIGNDDYVCGVGTPDEHYRDKHHMGVAMHWGKDWSQNRFQLTNAGRDDVERNYADYFHEYEFVWSPQGLWFSVDGFLVMQVPDPPIMDRTSGNCWTGFEDFGAPWTGPPKDPWPPSDTCDHYMAPFDQPFHFLFNVAVGGTNWFIPDGCVNRGGAEGHEKPWLNGLNQDDGMWQFWESRGFWSDTWTKDMMVDYIRVYKDADIDESAGTQLPAGCEADLGPRNCTDPVP